MISYSFKGIIKYMKLEQSVVNIFRIIFIIQYIFLFATSFLFSWVNTSINDEMVYFTKDSVIANIIGSLIVGVICYLFCKFAKGIDVDKLVICVSIIMALFSIIWVATSKIQPKADQYYICEAASLINNGDYSLFEKGEYLAVYPQQLGLVTLLRVIYYIFGNNNYLPFQVLSALSVGIIVYFGNKIVKKISNYNTTCSMVYVIAISSCIPLYLYTSFVYGEVLSLAFMTIAISVLLEIFDTFSYQKVVVLSLSMAAAILCRKNSEILLIAIVLVLLFKLVFNENKRRTIIVITAVLTGVVLQSAFIKTLYSSHQIEDAKAMPAMLWIAMGTNDDLDWGGSGWFDGTNNDVFARCNFDPELAGKAGSERVAAFFTDSTKQPISYVKFYFRKITSQWSAPMYQGIVMNTNSDNRYTGVASGILKESISRLFEKYMNVSQILAYLGVLLFLTRKCKEIKIEKYTGLLLCFGGFLFSIMWEAKARYIFPYFVLLLPYAAIGIATLLNSDYLENEIDE